METQFGPDFFKGNRQRLRELFTGTAPIVLSAHGQLQRNGDATYPFRQDGNFWYLTGLDIPDALLVMDKGQEYLILPEQSDYQQIFDGVNEVDAIMQASGITGVYSHKDGWKLLTNRLKKVKHVATLPATPPYIETYGMYANPARAELIRRMKNINNDLKLLDLKKHFARMRMVKQLPELKSIQAAINLTVSGLKQLKRNLPRYAHEYQLEADLTRHFLKHGADNAWRPVIASGANACQIHSPAGRSKLKPTDLILVDVGADVNHYAADISRTWAIGRTVRKRQSTVFQAVLEVQDYAMSLLEPGVTIRDNEKLVEHFMGEKLRALGLIKTIERDEIRRFFPHATSHYLGIDPHDIGDYSAALEPGMVLTVEPGIYIPKEGIGIRIEDDILITKTGHKNLSARLPRTLI